MVVGLVVHYRNIRVNFRAKLADRSFAPPRDIGYGSCRAVGGRERTSSLHDCTASQICTSILQTGANAMHCGLPRLRTVILLNNIKIKTCNPKCTTWKRHEPSGFHSLRRQALSILSITFMATALYYFMATFSDLWRVGLSVELLSVYTVYVSVS